MENDKLAESEGVPIDVLRPVGTKDQIMKAWEDFQSIKRNLLIKDDFYEVKQQDGSVKNAIRKSGWRKLAIVFGLADEIVEEKREYSALEPGQWTWRIKVRVYSRGGRTVEGIGACSTKERKFVHAEHDTYAMAHTRAKSRAIADMLGAADQVAEEAPEYDEPEHVRTPARKPGPDGWTDEELKAALANK